MATKAKILVPSQQGIVPLSAAGTTGTFDVQIGYRVHNFTFEYVDGSGAPTDWLNLVGDITVYRNTVAQRLHSALELDQLNGLNGSQYQRQQNGAAAAMRQQQTIYFAEPWRKDKNDTDMMAWSVNAANGWNSFQIKFMLLVAFPATASLTAHIRVDAPLPPPSSGIQTVKKVYRMQLPASGVSVDLTAFDKRDAYQTIVMKNPTAAYIQYVTLKWGPQLILEKEHQQDNVNDLVNLGLNPPTSQAAGAFGYAVVLDADDPINSALPATPANPLWMKADFSAAASGNIIALVERLGPFD